MTARSQSNPEVTLGIVAADSDVDVSAQRVLIVGQKTVAGTATSGALQTSIQNDASWDTLFGENSMIAAMIRAFRVLNTAVNIDAIGLDDNGAGVDATGTVVITGPATEDGTLTVIVGSKNNHSYSLSITSGDSADTIGTALAAAINADTKAPVTAANVSGTVTLTTVNAGTVGNDILIAYRGSVAGVGVTLTAMSGGSGDPDTSTVFDVVGNQRYQTIVWPYSLAGGSDVQTFVDARFNVTNNVLDGRAVSTQVDTFANLETAGLGLNSQNLVYFGVKLETADNHKGGAMAELTYVHSSIFAALRSFRLEEGTNISSIVAAANVGRDGIGGPAIASLPYMNTLCSTLPVVDVGLGFTFDEISNLRDAGISVIGNNSANNAVIMGQVVTTYKNNAAGNPDLSFKYLNYVDTISTIREYMVNNLRSTYAQTRLVGDDAPLQSGRSMANKSSIEATIKGFYRVLSGPDFVLTQAGRVAEDFFSDNLIVSVDVEAGAMAVAMKTPIVTQARSIVGTIQIFFDPSA